MIARLIGISILGTGCNGAYIEQIGKIKKWKDEGDVVADEMIINMEFGAFDKERAILPLTMFDNKLDRKSVVRSKPRNQSLFILCHIVHHLFISSSATSIDTRYFLFIEPQQPDSGKDDRRHVLGRDHSQRVVELD